MAQRRGSCGRGAGTGARACACVCVCARVAVAAAGCGAQGMCARVCGPCASMRCQLCWRSVMSPAHHGGGEWRPGEARSGGRRCGEAIHSHWGRARQADAGSRELARAGLAAAWRLGGRGGGGRALPCPGTGAWWYCWSARVPMGAAGRAPIMALCHRRRQLCRESLHWSCMDCNARGGHGRCEGGRALEKPSRLGAGTT